HLRIPYPLRGRAELGLLHTPTPPGQVLTRQLPPGTHLPQMPWQRGQERLGRHIAQTVPAVPIVPVVPVEGRACGHDCAHHYPTPFAASESITTLLGRQRRAPTPDRHHNFIETPRQPTEHTAIVDNHDEPRGNDARKHRNARP